MNGRPDSYPRVRKDAFRDANNEAGQKDSPCPDWTALLESGHDPPYNRGLQAVRFPGFPGNEEWAAEAPDPVPRAPGQREPPDYQRPEDLPADLNLPPRGVEPPAD